MTLINTASSFPNIERKDIGNGNFLHFINIENIDSKLEKFIDANIVKICAGSVDTDLPIIKLRLLEYLKPKKDTPQEIGTIAEFFTHLYLNELGFRQEFLFLNLEEHSLKKGFDGYYSYDNSEWIYESKSGYSSSIGISHTKKVKEAYEDIKNKVSGNVKNNPWQNAYNHSRHGDVGSPKEVYKNLKKISDDFTLKKFRDIGDFNIIPGSTIFMNGNWLDMDSNDLEFKLKNLVQDFKFKRINVICINKKTVESFWEYLKK